MAVPTRSETFSQLLEHLIKAQEHSAMMSHIEGMEPHPNRLIMKGWLGISEMLKRIIHHVTAMAQRRLN
jgi:hypothetical protein